MCAEGLDVKLTLTVYACPVRESGMNYIVDKRFNGVSVQLIGPFDSAEKAYEWIDRASKIDPYNCLGIDKYVHSCTTYELRRALLP